MKDTGYKGLKFPFRFNSSGGVSVSSTDEDTVEHLKEEIIQLINTRKGERKFNLDYGCNAHRYLFENINETTLALINDSIKEAIEQFLSNKLQIISIKTIDGAEENLDGCVIIYINVFITKFLKGSTIKIPLRKES